MTTQLTLVGEIELAIGPDTEPDFETLLDGLELDDWEECRIEGNRLILQIDHDAPGMTYTLSHNAVSDFINKHSKAGGVLRCGDRDEDFCVYGRTYEERRAAHQRYCDERANDWINARDNYTED